MAKDDEFLSSEEINKLENLNWSDVTNELIRNKELVRAENEVLFPKGEVARNKPANKATALSLEFLYDIPLTLRVEVGGKRMLVSEVLGLESEGILELDKAVGQPLDIYVNDVLVGYGVIVEQEKKYGIKITEILDEKERLAALHLGTSATINPKS